MESRKRVFISFDYDHDRELKVLLGGQAKNPDSPFDIADWSVKEKLPGDWKKKVRKKIKRSDVVAVVCGRHTNTATGVNAEVRIAQKEKVPYFLLAGRASGGNKKPKNVKSTDKMHKWTWDNLKKLIDGAR